MHDPTGLSLADLNQDGTLDVVETTAAGWTGPARGRAVWYRNDPVHPGSFSAAIVLEPVDRPDRGSVEATDLDLDGDADLLLGGWSNPEGIAADVSWYENLGGGDFGPLQNIGPQSHGGIRAADINGDGRPDILAAFAVEDRVVWFPAESGVYEAELASITGGGVASNHGGFTGSGFVDFFHATGDAVEFTVDAPSAGAYELSFRYANDGSSTRTMGLYVNGAEMPQGVAFTRTGSWNTWADLPVAVSLTAGANRVRLQTSGQNGPNLDSLSVRLVAPQEAVTYQAEAASVSGPVIAANHAGFTGSGFADYQRTSGDYVEFPVQVAADGAYVLAFRYANGSTGDRPLELSVDGQVLTGRLSFAPTGSWDRWGTTGLPVTLGAGRHLVRVASAGSNGPNLDALTVSPTVTPPPPVEPVTLQAETARLSGPVVAANHAGYTGTGFADYQHARGDFVEFTYTAPRAGDYVLGFRYANGSSSDRPLELRVNDAVATRSLSFAPTGSWRTWGLASPTVALAAGVNRIRLTTIGSNGPNLDSLTVQPAGGMVYLSQDRSVSGRLKFRYWEEPENAWDEPYLVDFDESESSSASDFGSFVGVATMSYGNAEIGGSYFLGVQDSRLTDSGIVISGVLEASLGSHIGGGYGDFDLDSNLDVTFELNRPRDYVVTYAFDRAWYSELSLTDLGGAIVFAVPPNSTTGTRAGTLAPGQYRFVFHQDSDSGEYAVELALNQ